MDEYTAEQVLRGYERIERSVSEFGEQVPLLPQNELPFFSPNDP